MTAPVVASRFHHSNPIADLNRQGLRTANVTAISVVGGPGCGKTTLIDLTIESLQPALRVGVIACDFSSKLDSERLTQHSDQVVQVNVGEGGVMDASYIRDALEWLDLKSIDLLFIENIGSVVEKPRDLGQNLTAAMFSVAAGDDKPSRHPEMTKAANAIVLSKIDLLDAVPFDIASYRRDVKALNPEATTFELSALKTRGCDKWLNWLRKLATH